MNTKVLSINMVVAASAMLGVSACASDDGSGASTSDTGGVGDDSGNGEGTTSPGDGDGDGDGLDTTPPTILGVSPSNGEVGVRADAEIVVRFSEPMDQVSTEGAFESDDLSDVAFEWSDSEDELTITPAEGLEYATGSDAAMVEAEQYTFSVATTAQDTSGNDLEPAPPVTFSTLKAITTELPPDTSLSGTVREDGTTSELCQVGDSVSVGNAWYRCAYTFQYRWVPPSLQTWSSAVVRAEHDNNFGDPWEWGEELELHDIDYATLDVPGLTQPSNELGVLDDTEAAGPVSFDVLDEVREDWNVVGSTGNTQFLFRFDPSSGFDEDVDIAAYSDVTLEVAYLVP